MGGKSLFFLSYFHYFLKRPLCTQKWSSWPVSERSWSLLGRTWRLLGRSWPDFGAPEAPKGSPKETQEVSKRSPKCGQFSYRFLARFRIDLGGPKGWDRQGGRLHTCAQAPKPLPVYMYIYIYREREIYRYI